MKTEKIKMRIYRLDYKNPKAVGLPCLPTLSKLSEIEDVNEIRAIHFEFRTDEERDLFISKFPKYFNLKGYHVMGYDPRREIPTVSIQFNTFWTNNVTGEKNETAISRRIKFIKKLKEIIY